jgi:hypothetical protein
MFLQNVVSAYKTTLYHTSEKYNLNNHHLSQLRKPQPEKSPPATTPKTAI